MGEKIKVEFMRNGQPQSVEVPLTSRMADDQLAALNRYDVMPTYYIFGGLVFCPLTTDLAKAWGANWTKDAPVGFLAKLNYNIKSDTIDEAVVLLRGLAGNINQGYQDIGSMLVKKVNGREIRSLRELIATVENSAEPFVRFESETGMKVVLDRERVRAEQADILKTYQVSRDRSLDLVSAEQMVAAKEK